MMRILVVEDDEALARGLCFNLAQDGYEVRAAASGEAGFEDLVEFDPHLVLLDLNLPDVDGLDVLRRMRAAHDERAVLCLTARGQETDVVMGLGLGADDYVTKPFALAELRARIGALLRRVASRPAAPSDTASPPARFGNVRVDLAAHRVLHPDREEELTPIETEVFAYLLARRGQAVERAVLLRELWGIQRPGATRTLDNHILRLRKKLEADPTHPTILQTVHGAGYRLAPE